MPQEVKERIARCLRPELEHVGGLSSEDIDAIIGAFTLIESTAPRSGHVQYRLAQLRPEIEQRSDVQLAISRAVQECGYYVAGEE